MTKDNTTRWSVIVSEETDRALRAFLGRQGMRKGDLSKFIEEAVRWRMFEQTVEQARAGFADLRADEVQALVDEASQAVRQEMWPAPTPAST